jgi:NAD(P)-dependent dehydrogenase (short-subunit alcohol dehydrogenase family)
MRGVSNRNAESSARLRDWASTEGVDLQVIEMDVTDDGSVRACVSSILAATGRIDVVVNNAGGSAAGPIEAFSIEQMRTILDLNALGPMRVNKAVLPSMRERRSGLIIHISSTLGRVLPGSGGLYPASKWALEGLAESLSYQVKAFGIDAVIVEPGAFPSTATANAMRADDQAIARAYQVEQANVSRPPTQPGPGYRLPDLQEVADAVLRLVQMPAGSRPLRTVVGPIFTEGVPEYNETYERTKAHLAEVLKRPDQAVTWVRR